MTSLHHNRVDSSSSSSSRGIYSAFIGGPEACTRHSVSPYVCDSATVVAQAATDPLLSLFTHTHTAHAVFTAPRPERHPPSDFLNKVSPRGLRDDMPPADGSSTVAKIAADLRPSADGSAVRTSVVAVGG